MYVELACVPDAALATLDVYAQFLDLAPLPGSVSRFGALPMDACVIADNAIRPTLDALMANTSRRLVTRWSVISLLPTHQIPLHVDDVNDQTVRLHAPLRTSDACWSFHDGAWQHLERGRLYQMDAGKPHGSVNWGMDVRWHLMVDVVVEGA